MGCHPAHSCPGVAGRRASAPAELPSTWVPGNSPGHLLTPGCLWVSVPTSALSSGYPGRGDILFVLGWASGVVSGEQEAGCLLEA